MRMSLFMGRMAAVLLCVSAIVARAQAAVAPAPPVALERFFARPAMQQVALSPSGRWLGALGSVPGGRVAFHLVDLDSQEPPRTVEASATDDVAWFLWVSDDWVIFGLRDTEQRRYVHRGSGLLAMRRDGSDARQIIARGYRDAPKGAVSPGYQFLGLGPPGTLDLLLGNSHYDASGEFTHQTLSAVNIETQKWRRIHEDQPRAGGWRFDPQGRPRLITRRDGKQIKFLWAEADGDRIGPWREIALMDMLNEPWSPAYIDHDGRLFVTTYDRQGYTELRAFDFATGRPSSTAVLATPGFSTGVGALRDRRGGPVIGVNVTLDATTTVWFTPTMKALQERVDARWPGRVNVLHCRPCDAPRRLVVYSYADNDPGQFLVFLPEQDKWQLLASVQPDVDPARMAHLAFERIRARDGRDLPVWVTRPPGKIDKPLPAVVLVHGGPHDRAAYWRWNAEAQFLASRGYVVIEPEFRGSTGFGAQHYRAGWKQWGGGMIDDLTDALRHVVAAGVADAGRVCVMGGSYGGYAALMSLVKEPDLYRCGVAFAAVSDPRHRFDFHWSDLSSFSRREVLPLLIGDPVADAELLAAHSPLEQVKRIKAPILLVHGDDDYRVPIENGERMRDALKKAGKEFEWVMYVDEGHGFSKPSNELDYWRRVEAFLAKHLR